LLKAFNGNPVCILKVFCIMFNLRPIEFIKVECEHCTYRAQIAKMIHNVNAYITAVPMSNIQRSKKSNSVE